VHEQHGSAEQQWRLQPLHCPDHDRDRRHDPECDDPPELRIGEVCDE
jgi:hypothetical protein